MNETMTRTVFLFFILAAWTALANCARPHVQPLYPDTEDIKSSAALSTSPSSSPDCTKAIYAMSDCIPYMSEGIQTTKPEPSCCSGFETVVKRGPDCVCQSFESLATLGVRMNMTKAMTLSSACGMKNAPPLNNCNLPMPPGVDNNPAMSPQSGSPPPKSHPKVNIVPAPSVVRALVPSPVPSPSSSGAHSISTKLAFIVLNMVISAASLM